MRATVGATPATVLTRAAALSAWSRRASCSSAGAAAAATAVWCTSTCMVQAATHAAGYQGWWCCGTCKQDFTGAVQVGLARAWWATVAANDEGDLERLAAAGNLAHAHTARASTPRRRRCRWRCSR